MRITTKLAAAALTITTSNNNNNIHMLQPPKNSKDPFYKTQKQNKIFSDYNWDPNFPGTLKPGTAKENYDLVDVLKDWENKPFDAVMQLSMDEQMHIPLKPPEGSLQWLERTGLLSHEEDEQIVEGSTGLLDDEFDLEEDIDSIVEPPILDAAKDQGATMSDFL